MQTLKKLLFNNPVIAKLLPFYTHSLYTIIRIFVIIYGF